MPEIVPDIKLSEINFIKDKIIESKEDDTFDLVSELRRESDRPNTTTEALKYKSFCSLLADLYELNWSFQITRKGFDIHPYFGAGITKTQAKEANQKAALNSINNPYDINFIKKIRFPPVGSKLKSVDHLIDNGKELKEIFEKINKKENKDKILKELKTIIKPEIEYCEGERICSETNLRLMDVWRYFRLTWSMPYQTSNARTMPFLIRNGARPYKPVIGIFQLVQPFFNNTGRNLFLKWNDYFSTMGLIKDKIITPSEIGKTFLERIKQALNETRYDDFNIKSADLKKPTLKLINHFSKLTVQFRNEEVNEEKEELKYKKKIKIRTRKETDSYKERSEKKLFLKKRTKRLSKLLFARKLFNECDLKKNPKRALAIMLQTTDGKRAMNIALEYIRQNIYSTQSADLNVCGAIAPYNEIIGGKLIALLTTSKNVLEKYNENYEKEESIISSAVAGRAIVKSAKLLFLTVSSLYDVGSSQYNRLKLLKKDHPKLKTDLIWHEAGSTEGLGSYHISDKTTDLLNKLTQKVKKFEKKSISGKGHSQKIRKIITALKILKLKPDDIMMHNQKRKNFIFFHKKEKDMFKYLYGLKKIENFDHCSSINSITEAWIERWLPNRIRREETLNKLEKLDSDYIKNIFEPVMKNYKDTNKQKSLFVRVQSE